MWIEVIQSDSKVIKVTQSDSRLFKFNQTDDSKYFYYTKMISSNF